MPRIPGVVIQPAPLIIDERVEVEGCFAPFDRVSVFGEDPVQTKICERSRCNRLRGHLSSLTRVGDSFWCVADGRTTIQLANLSISSPDVAVEMVTLAPPTPGATVEQVVNGPWGGPWMLPSSSASGPSDLRAPFVPAGHHFRLVAINRTDRALGGIVLYLRFILRRPAHPAP